MTNVNKLVQTDILRYKKNKLAANLALLGLAFNCLYFMLLYGIKASTMSDSSGGTVTTWFASMMMGFSVILTLVFLLVAFLSSEGIKGYNKKFAYVLWGLAAWQILRIFGYPLYGLKNNLLTVNYFWLNPTTSTAEFIIMLVYLCASSACLISSGIIGFIRATELEKLEKNIASGELNMDELFKKMETEDEMKSDHVDEAIKAIDAEMHEEEVSLGEEV